ncbi:MAG: hypothetical protein IKY83_05240, partial [Proteobacteria bacterium]|nr:hypothetical protein [Pseudomonadota bacterium]
MRHQNKIFLTRQRRCTAPLLAVALLAVTGIGGCDWDSALYTDLVGSEGDESVVTPCPNDSDEDSNKVLKYIKIGSSQLTRDNCLNDDECEYKNAFKFNICPANYLCNESGLFCYSKGNENTITCDGKGIIPSTDPNYCGARGACTSSDVKSEDYKGAKCIGGQNCEDGYCVCPPGTVFCNNTCIDPMTNKSFCGAKGLCSDEEDTDNYKGKDCKAQQCVDGQCIDACPKGEHTYGDQCELDTVDNCGQHGYVCSEKVPGWVDGGCENGACVATECNADEGYTLDKGKCNAACIGSQVKCGGLCRDPLTDNEYCGATGTIVECATVGTKCGEGEVCVGGTCLKNSCKGDLPDLCEITYEDGTKKNECRNVKKEDVDHCGACNYVCANNPANHATSNTCIAGVCQYICDSGYTNCGGVTAQDINCIKTTDLQTDGQNCGSCGNVCGTGKACVGGKCVQNSCSGSTPDLCVVGGQNVCKNTKSNDAAHCGACNYACADNPATNASSNTCKAGVCQYTCNTGYTNCGGETASSINCIKTTDLQTDGQNCGSCGNVCGTGKACVGGKCVQNSCSGSTPDLCVVGGQNVCKKVSGTDAEHCGACNYACANNPATNATSNTCLNGVCQYTCDSNYTNCGGNTAASINCIKTTDLQTDSNNCGKCNNVCKSDESCVSGKCQKNTCSSGQTLCALGSCKTLTGTDKDNCGACNYACANNPAPNATSNTCKDGVCQYTCDTNYTNCGGVTAASINCIKTTDLQTDSNNCGKCNNVCKSDESCVSGKCQKKTSS